MRVVPFTQFTLLLIALTCVNQRAQAEDTAEDPEVCSVSYARGQEERLAGRLFNARTAFLRCASAPCPSQIVDDCSRWVNEVEADLPTVRVSFKDEHGARIKPQRVTIDRGAVPLDTLSRPIVLEAGPHQVLVEAHGYAPERVEIALRPSDREVPVVVTLRPPQAPSGDTPDERDVKQGSVPTASWVFGGLGAAALGTSIYFGVTANSEYQELKRNCAPGCEPSATRGMHTKAVVADVTLISSLALLTVSAILYLTRDTAEPVAATLHGEVVSGDKLSQQRFLF